MASKRVFAQNETRTQVLNSQEESIARSQVVARGVYRKFGISRIMLRQLALEGKIPGMRKASW